MDLAKSRAWRGLTTATANPPPAARRPAQLAAAGGLHHHQRHTQRLQRCGQRRMPIGIVVKTSGAELRAQHRDIDVRLGFTSMPTTTEEADMVNRSLVCACARPGRVRVNCWASGLTSAVIVRHRLSHGLQRLRRHQVARSGLAASTAFGLYRAGLV